MPQTRERRIGSTGLNGAEVEALAGWYDELAANALRAGDYQLCEANKSRAIQLRVGAGGETVRTIVAAPAEDELLWEFIEDLVLLPVEVGSG